MATQPNVVMLILDACRRDALGPYVTGVPSASPVNTPVLDRLAARGVVIKDCQSTSSCTALSIASILTGRGPPHHGITTLVGASLFQTVRTLGGALGSAGYATAFFPSTAVLNRTTRLNGGFSHFDDEFLDPLYRDLHGGTVLDLPLFRRHFYAPPVTRVVPGSLRFCEQTTESALAWMARTPDPLCVVIHFLEPHYPYWPPPPWRVSDNPLDRANYHASLSHLDAVCVARLVEVIMQRGSDTVLAITSDHGEYWGTHGFRSTGDHGDLYQDVLAVPLIFWGHGSEHLRFTELAPWSHLDIMPTILGVVGCPIPDDLTGLNRLEGDEERPRPSWEDAAFNDPDYVEATGRLRRGGVAVRAGSYKLIARAPGLGVAELYELDNDPGELRNLVDFLPGVRRQLESLLPPRIEMTGRSVPELGQRLAALGYL